MDEWSSTIDAMPVSGQEVIVKTPGGDVRPLVFSGNMWWLPDRSMYVYFNPTHWRPLNKAETAERHREADRAELARLEALEAAADALEAAGATVVWPDSGG